MRWGVGLFLVLLLVGFAVYGGDVVNWHRSRPANSVNELAAWASIYGLLISFVGLAASAYAAWGVSQIRIKFLAKARLPTLGKRLLKDAADLSDIAGAVPVPHQRKTEVFSSLKANLNSVRPHLPSNLKQTQKTAIVSLGVLSNQSASAISNQPLGKLPSFWPTYEAVHLLKLEIDNYLAEQKWDG